MNTEHEGGHAGSERPESAGGESVGQPSDAQTRAVTNDAAAEAPVAAQDTVVQPVHSGQDTVVQPIAVAQEQPAPQAPAPQVPAPQYPVDPPADPALAGFPPPIAAPQAAAPAPPAPPVTLTAPAAMAAEGFATPPPPAFPPAPSAQSAQPTQPLYGGEQQHAQGGWSDGPVPPYAETVGLGEPYPSEPRKKGRGGLIALLAATALVAGGLGGGLGSWLESRNTDSTSSTTVSTSVDPKSLSRAPDSIAGIAAKALPSVVTIEASNSSESGTGTGFVYDTQGHILTNNHVVAPSMNGGKLTVKFSDGSSYPATVVGHAQGYDVAVIKLATMPNKPLVPLALGNSDQVAVGDTTIAIGAPFGLSGTVTSGIVSAKNRPVASGDSTGAQTSYMNALQTDASINPGNSGGPLMNAQGQVIGIDSAIQSTGSNTSGSQSGSIGLGFAIPINQARWVADQLIKTGQPVYPIIGILRDDSYSGNGAKILSAPNQGVAPITAGGPADKAGLKPGDVITALDGVQIDSGPTLVSEIWSHHPGDTVSITYTRDGSTHTTSLTLGSRTGDQ